MGRTLRFRLIASYSVVVVAFGAASAFILSTLAQIREATAEVNRREEAVRYGLTLASCGRDQYIHTAHLLITHDERHVQEVREVVKRMQDCQMHVREAATSSGERDWIDDLDAAASEFRRTFFEGIVPAVREGRLADALALHEKSEGLLTRIIDADDRLNASFRQRIEEADERARSLSRRAVDVTLVSLALALVASIGVGWMIGRSILRPLQDLVEGTRSVARGDLALTLPHTTLRELEALNESFQRMTRELAQRERELMEAEKMASLGVLAASVAHQINNPLGVILGYARLLQTQRAPDVAQALRVIADEAGEATMIVETLLSLARPGKLSTDEVVVASLLEDTVAHVQRYRPGAASRIVLEAVPAEARLRTDAKKLQQALVNLMINGLDAMPSEGVLRVRAIPRSEPPAGVAIEVQDEGPGLTDAEMSRLFDPYFTTKKTGTGLGLSITSEIVRALGGGVEVRRGSPRGCTFVVRVPATAG